MPRRAHLSAWLCLAFVMCAAIGGVPGVMLCFGPDGHVALEVASAADCDGCDPADEGRSAPDRAPPASYGPECPCEDVLLPGIESPKPGAKRTFESAARTFVVRVWSVGALAERAGRPRGGIDEARRASSSRQRSTVLLV
jgi:hypothetical protein